MLPGGNSFSVNQSYKDPAGDEKFNIMTPRHSIDVSAMECDTSVIGGLSANTANEILMGLEDGGAAGTGTTDIATENGGSGGWTDVTPKSLTMSTSASDLDADDWVNLVYNEEGSVAPAGETWHMSFVYGVPGGIF